MLAIMFLYWIGFGQSPVTFLEGQFTVTKVTDGDTVELETLGTVRLIGIDTPEKYPSEKLNNDVERTGIDAATLQALGEQASTFTTSLVLGKQVWVELDVEQRDRYGRLLAYLYIEDPNGTWQFDGKTFIQVNQTIIANGYAEPLTIAPNVRYESLYVEAARAAREQSLGLWANETAQNSTATCLDSPLGVYFSEYIEGSGNNKALEIYNGSGKDLDMSCFQVQMFFNGQMTPDLSVNLQGVLPVGQSLVLWHEDSSNLSPYASNAPYNQISGFGWFNGNDAIALLSHGQIIDALGQIGNDADWGKDQTLRRKPEISQGRTDPNSAFDPELEWLELPKDSFDGLGTR